MGWVSQVPSGRYKATFRQSDGTKKNKTFDYEFEAAAWLEEVEARLDAVQATAADTIPVYSPPPRPPATWQRQSPLLVDQAANWLHRRGGRQLAAQTLNWYEREVRRLHDSCLVAMRIDAVRAQHVETWLADLADAGKGPSTIRGQLKVLRMVFADAVDNDLIRKDPTAKIPLPRAGKRRYRVLEPVEDTKLLLAAKPDAGAFILAALDAGLRWGEIAGLSHRSIDGDMLEIWQVVDRGTGLLRGWPKDHDPRRAPMTPRLAAALKPLADAAKKRGDREGLLFTSSTGTQLDYWNWARDYWYPARKNAQLPDPQPRFHDLRHTYVTRLHRAGVPTREIGVVVGHADEHITATYVHELEERARAALIRAALAGYA